MSAVTILHGILFLSKIRIVNFVLGTITFQNILIRSNVYEKHSFLISTDALTKELDLVNYYDQSTEIVINDTIYYYKVDFLTEDCHLGQFFQKSKFNKFY